MDIEVDVTDTHRSESDSAIEYVCERLTEIIDEREANYTEFYWYLWESDSGNESS